MQVPKRKSQENRKHDNEGDQYLSADMVVHLKSELERLTTTDRKKAVEDLSVAQAMGDLSENAAYQEAKSRLGSIDGRVFSLKERLKHAIIIDHRANVDGMARIGSTVIVRFKDIERSFEITGSQETSPGRGRISFHSPVGAALMGHKAGDTVTFTVNDQPVSYEILKVT